MFILQRLSFVLITVFCVLLTACKDTPKKKSSNKVKKAVPVEIVTVKTGLIQSYIHAYANIEASNSVDVNARMSELVKVIYVEEGDTVQKGDKLLTLQNDEQRIALNKIRATLDKNQQDLNRQEHLKSRNLVSGKEYASAQNLVRQSILDKESAQLNYDYTFVTAPISGTVTERHVNVGNNVKVNDPLFSLVDFDSLVTLVYLPQDALAFVKVNQQAIITTDAQADKPFNGRVLRISPVIEPRSGTFKVTVALDSNDFLRPGMYVKVSLKIQEQNNAVLIPKSAVVTSDEQTYVYRVKDNLAKRIAIDTAMTDINFITPKSGIYAGDQLIIAGQNNLKDNALVRIINPQPQVSQTVKHTSTEVTPPLGIISTIPIKRDDESRKAFKQRMREYVTSLPEDERQAFLKARKKQRENRQQDAQ